MTTLRSTAIVCAIAAASMGFSTVSFAQRDNDNNRPQLREGLQDYSRARGPQVIRPQNVRPGYNPQMNQPGQYDARRDAPVYYYGARGPEFRRGGYIPREYRNRQYVVNDYRAYRLAPPPRGQQWVQVGGDYVLIAIATGLIANIVLNH